MTAKSLARRLAASASLLGLTGCATTPPSPQTNGVAIYQAPLDGQNAMPAGCREIRRTPPQPWAELDRVAPIDPYQVERAAAAAAGGNVLLVLDRMTRPRSDFDCPAAAKITDCPRSVGAWYDLVFVSYACSPPSLGELPKESRS